MWLRVLAAFCALSAAGCAGQSGAPALKELQRVTSGDVTIVLLADHEDVKQGRDSLILEFRRADGALRDMGTVRINATMPMAGMPPMLGSVDVAPTATAGRYTVSTDLNMTGGWQMVLEWNGPAGRGTGRLQQTVR